MLVAQCNARHRFEATAKARTSSPSRIALHRLSGARHTVAAQEARAPAAPVALAGPVVEVAAAVHAMIGTARPWRPMTPARLHAGGLDARVPRAERDGDHPRRRPALLEPGTIRRAYARFQSITLGGAPPCVSAHARISLTSASRHASITSASRGAVRATTSKPIAAMLAARCWQSEHSRHGSSSATAAEAEVAGLLL
jgi:hypothetical protein